MKTFWKKWTFRGLAGFAALGMLAAVITYVLGPDPTLARAADIKKAHRTVKPAQGKDFRLVVPKGDYLSGPGKVEPPGGEVDVSGDGSGRIVAIPVKEGDRVQKGDTLAVLEHSDQDAAVAVATVEVEQAKAELAIAKSGQRPIDVHVLEAQADAARQQAQLSEATYQRTKKLATDGASSPEQLDNARYKASADEAAARAADKRVKAARQGQSSVQIRAARIRLKAARARLAQAQARLDQRTVRAPGSGRILKVNYRVGEFYSAGQAGQANPLMVTGDTRELDVRVDVDERDIGHLTKGAKALLVAEAYPRHNFHGHVIRIGLRMGPKTVNSDKPGQRADTLVLQVVVKVDDPKGLVSGQRVDAYIERSASVL